MESEIPNFNSISGLQNTMSCATEIQAQIYTSPVQLIYAAVQIVIFLSTVIGSVMAVMALAKKSTIPDSTRVLLVGSLFFANTHELAYVSSPLKTFQLNLFHTNTSCYPLSSTSECVLTTTILAMGISGNMLIQSALSVDRLLATIFSDLYPRMKAIPGILLLIAVTIPSALTYLIMRHDAVLDDYQLFCSNWSSNISTRANSYLEYCSYSTIVYIVINLLIIWKNRVDERKVCFDINQQYQTWENLKTTKAICYLSIAQFLAMFLYTGGVLLMRKNRENIPTMVYFNVIVWVYAPPYACVSLAPLILFSLWNLKRQRQSNPIHRMPMDWKRPYYLYTVAGFYLVVRLLLIDSEHVQENKKLESIPIECDSVVNGSENGRLISRAKQWDWHFSWVEEELFQSKNICTTIDKYFTFSRKPLSQEEADYPLAYGLVVYKTIVQVMMQLSLFYQPQHLFCITVDMQSSDEYKTVIEALPSCFPNMRVFIGEPSEWGSFGILKNVYTCFNWLSTSQHPWKYYQYLSGTDLPIRTNLEMVRIFKALNGSINTDVSNFEVDRYKNMEGVLPPIPIYKSSMSVVMPRNAADFVITSPRVQKLLSYLKKTWIPDESFWSTISGSPALLPVPGAIRVRDILWLRKHFKMRPPDVNTVDSVGTSYIGRYQVWGWQKDCYGKIKDFSCVFGVEDIEEIMTRPELIAHKLYLEFEPAAFMCMFKEVRRRTESPNAIKFNAKSYSEMPTVELLRGKTVTQLTHPNWLVRDSFYNPETEDIDRAVL